ncbi:hypothetical protein BGX34_001453 [Mortierella sp. NVP85]|nr:hypothetical protein BGX34_001453 [Mortierella sp. NVP85]
MTPRADDRDEEDGLGDVDIVTLAECSKVSMGSTFHVEPFRFSARVGDVDFGPEFDIYFDECSNEVYDTSRIADFLALSGILFLGKKPTALQAGSFAEKHPKLVKAMEQRVLKSTEECIKEALARFRRWKDAYNIELRASDKDKARASMEDLVNISPKSSLKTLFTHGCLNLPTKSVSPWSKADQTTGFVHPMLSCLVTKPDQARLVHTATAPTTGSLYVQLFKDLGSSSKHPDLIVNHQKAVDVGFGEISFEAGFSKDQGDLCRLCLWVKRALDQLQTEFEGLQDVDLNFVQVISKDCHIYQMSKFGSVCVVMEISKFEIVQDLESLLQFEDNLPAWLALEKSFMRLLDQMSSCTPREDKSKARPCYPGLSTPSSRNMPH